VWLPNWDSLQIGAMFVVCLLFPLSPSRRLLISSATLDVQ
jgi:hypothetical protein